VVAREVAVANTLQKLFEEIAGARLWLWHERSARAAAQVLSSLHFQLIAVDLALPDELPGAALRMIKRQAPDTPLVLLSSPDDLGIDQNPLTSEHARLAGAIAVVPKGETASIVRILHNVLHGTTVPRTRARPRP
jgi:DNA-binding NarL/FixJ family response regulator